MLTSEKPEQNSMLQAVSTIPIVPVQQPLTPQEIERMCKAFIKLITAKEITTNGNNGKTTENNTNVPA